ncbi:MAG: hypothetical protein AB7F59_09880 [Bdellovibrionales bacterium]
MKTNLLPITLFAALMLQSLPANANKKNILVLEKMKPLLLEKSLEKGRPPHVSAASGLVKKDSHFYIISDDENSLFRFAEKSKLEVIPLISKSLPANNVERKKVKSDFESALLFSAEDFEPHGAFLAVPSGSTPQRQQAALIPFKNKSDLDQPQTIDFAPFYKHFQKYIDELNIEGALIHKNKVHLFQRGNGKKGMSGIFELPVKEFIALLKNKKWDHSLLKFRLLKIGKLDKVRLSITDAANSRKGILLLAAAENTMSTYKDGEVKGSVLAILEENEKQKKGDFKILGRLSPDVKAEGIYVDSSGTEEMIYLVDDADDPAKPSHLYRLKLPNSL